MLQLIFQTFSSTQKIKICKIVKLFWLINAEKWVYSEDELNNIPNIELIVKFWELFLKMECLRSL
jgi:hypothetical protein